MKDLPIGNDDFKKIRRNNGYYIDKSELIEEILNRGDTDIFLFTRPRRFGKSLNISMLDAFFNIEYKGNDWFDGLHVMNNDRCVELMNTYPVISLNLKGLNLDSMDFFLESFAFRMADTYAKHRYLSEADDGCEMLKAFETIRCRKGNRIELEGSLRLLTDMLGKYHGKKVIVLIDEYDNPVLSSYGTYVQSDIGAFLKNLLDNTLESDGSLEFVVMTGIMPLLKPCPNNLCVSDIFDRNFDECFGFTESEVRELLSYYGHPEKFEECRAWYDGYTFGDTDVYNPWSLLNYVTRDFEPDTYWAGTSGNQIIQTLLDNADDSVWNNLTALSKRDTVICELDQYVVYSDIEHNSKAIYSIMAMSGYLKAKKTDYGYEIRIPNNEISYVYSNMILNSIGRNDIWFRSSNLFKALQKGDTDYLEAGIHSLIQETISAKVLDSEHAYQAYLIGMMMGFCGDYEISGDRLETGDGFADILFRNLRGPGPNMVLELKKSRSEDDMERNARAAMDQILDRDYMHGMKGRTLLYGISFFSKKPFIISEELDL